MTQAGGYRGFPPGRGELLVPTGSRRAALAALALYPACRRRGAAVQRAAWILVRLAGARALPGGERSWRPPVPEAAWEAFVRAWHEAVGEWDETAVFTHSDPGRRGVALLLLRRGRAVAFVKLRPDAGELARERAALEAIARFGPKAFAAPAPLAAGAAGGWSWLAVTPLPPRIHRPASGTELEPVLAEIAAGLAELPSAPGTPDHWRPMHGDFTPWNLRRFPGAGLVLVDWEEASWGPPGADRVLFQASEAALGGSPPEAVEDGEAVEYWRRRVPFRGGDRRGEALANGRELALAAMAGGAGERITATGS